MTDLVPRDSRIGREALERIIRRAAELQAGEREIGEGLTEGELMQLGDDVGIPAAYLRQALMEERTRTAVAGGRGLLAWLTGPRYVATQRTLALQAGKCEAALQQWMAEGELLRVKRRYPDRTTWEPQQGTLVSLKRSFGIGGRQYVLAGAREIAGHVVDLEGTRCHVQLLADLGNSQRQYAIGSMMMAGAGAATSGVFVALGVLLPVALVPAAIALPLSAVVARSRRASVERTQVALEQVLDRLEHGEIKMRQSLPPSTPFGRLAEEIRKNLGV